MQAYSEHFQLLLLRYQQLCEQHDLDAIFITSGSLSYYPDDDQTHTYRANPYAQQWLPYAPSPDTWIEIPSSGTPTLHWPAQQDFWHCKPTRPSGEWTRHWEINAQTSNEWMKHIRGNIAILSTTPKSVPDILEGFVNPSHIVQELNYYRAYKSAWEIEQMALASHKAAKGHIAAEQAFKTGLSEFEIHLAYLSASQQQQIEEPYGSIVAVNEAAAILHYEQKRHGLQTSNQTLLIDAGATVNGYASDITRTVTTDIGLFNTLIKDVEKLQLELVDMCRPNTPYELIHEQALLGTAHILLNRGICKHSVEKQLAMRIPQVFFPHGIGHLLGLQVHDVGGRQVSPDGSVRKPAEHAPYLRLTRELASGMVVTIEPGLYFIPMLLDKMISDIPDHGCDLALIESLKPMGGIRIEDNVVVTDNNPRNLSREAFAAIFD